jgi:hypothetical protein
MMQDKGQRIALKIRNEKELSQAYHRNINKATKIL